MHWITCVIGLLALSLAGAAVTGNKSSKFLAVSNTSTLGIQLLTALLYIAAVVGKVALLLAGVSLLSLITHGKSYRRSPLRKPQHPEHPPYLFADDTQHGLVPRRDWLPIHSNHEDRNHFTAASRIRRDSASQSNSRNAGRNETVSTNYS